MWRLVYWGVPLLIIVVAMLPGPVGTLVRGGLDPIKAARVLDNVGKSGVAATISGDTGSPLDHVREYDNQWKGDDQVLATELGLPVFRSQVFATPGRATVEDLPQTVARVALAPDCAALARPEAAAQVVFIRSGARMKAGLIQFDPSRLRELVGKYLQDLRRPGFRKGSLSSTDAKGLLYDAFDIAITRTDAPVHLVLSGSFRAPRLWNLHLAPGARLSRITLLGGEADGVAHVPQGVPVEAISRKAMAACGADEKYPYSDVAFLHKSIGDGHNAKEYAGYLAQGEARYRAWAEWFGARYGVEPLQAEVGFDVSLGVLIGPVPATPEARLVWASLKGAPVLLADSADVLPPDDKAVKARIEEKAREIAGSSFEALRQNPKIARLRF